jgi:hypothetical protein
MFNAYEIYPQKRINPTFKSLFSINILMIFFIFAGSVIFTSCKTCNCPAYSKADNIHPDKNS